MPQSGGVERSRFGIPKLPVPGSQHGPSRLSHVSPQQADGQPAGEETGTGWLHCWSEVENVCFRAETRTQASWS